ncbi:RWD-domain-containing protein [Stereum hirsutum FP-91666 SS1]|uniref:RWD-domain-containing protein n=1 Tax=Stereum hirsutum (strain FP-91666) TaxID=721885 RepID=UPI000440A315|nr:RWD-domain-containing protein [Stereum hirsutum FP-91666 SS1]EIM92759.1 RWD-domain-containing protein [Stereum hirsutum FP-91666 SS1]
MTDANDEDKQTCASLQLEEWEVLESIYPDCVSSDPSKGVKSLEIPIEFGEEQTVIVVDDETMGSTSLTEDHQTARSEPQALSLSSLPPVLLQFILPETYPMSSPPSIMSLHATNSWLARANQLQKMLEEMWQPGEGVLYTWVEWLRNADFLGTLDLLSEDETGREVVRLSHPAPHVLATHLINNDVRSKSSQFAQTSYTCSICISSLKGARCLQLDCGHVFCRSCLDDFWSMCITEGDVGRVGCPSPDCVKESREVGEEELRRAVTEDKIVRWKWLRRKRSLERDPSVIHCPMSVCQEPVPKTEAMGSEGSGWDRLRTCQSCGYSFCSFCRRTWHGPISDCPMPVFEQFVQEYMSLPEESPSRRALEQRYGKANIARLVLKYEEEKANREWLAKSTMSCPSCQIHVEKSHGCNHMTCAKCRQHFCYRCGDKLNGNNPYLHFSTLGTRCYSKLFDYESVEDGWQPVEGFDAVFDE